MELLQNITDFVATSKEYKTRSAFIEAAVTEFYLKKKATKLKSGLYKKDTAKVKKGS